MEQLSNASREYISQAEKIKLLDPLGLDEFFPHLPELNRQGNPQPVIDQLTNASISIQNSFPHSSEEAIACLRDLDFLIGSSLRHNIDPLSTVPDLEQQLIELGEKSGTIPRGSVYTYAAVNPNDGRRRSFTGSAEEEIFIDVVATSVDCLENSYRSLSCQTIGNNYEFCDVINQVADSVDVMVDSIIKVHRTVSPQFFTEKMRPYFEPLVINGTEYAGAGGAQMQLLGVDFILWGIDERDPIYVDYLAENYKYLTPGQQKAMEKFSQNNGQGIVTWISENAKSGDDVVKSTANLLRKLRRFRYPHRKVAQDNFKVRDDGAVGSGRYTPEILDYLIQKTEYALTTVEATNE